MALPNRRQVTELAPGRGTRRLCREPPSHTIRRQFFEVRRGFLLKASFIGVALEQAAKARQQLAEVHDRCSSIRLTIATVRDQFSVSAANCFLPGRVIE